MSDLTLKPGYGFVETLQFKTLVSKFENGAEQRRAKWLTGLSEYELTYNNQSAADMNALYTLFNTKLGQYASFSWTHPVSGATITVRFKEDSFKTTYVAYGIYTVSFTLVQVK
ncbi:MAG TPA: DUF2460 domain-containing protein [Candidatus Omnitrophota bacterium]|nr:DUF2460 domain-containing protein [Candidatus Omnitrophota bacterium]